MQSLDSKLRFATPESRRPNTLFCSPRLMMIIGCSDSQTLAGLTAQPRTIPRQQAEASVWNDSNGIVQIPSFSSNFWKFLNFPNSIRIPNLETAYRISKLFVHCDSFCSNFVLRTCVASSQTSRSMVVRSQRPICEEMNCQSINNCLQCRTICVRIAANSLGSFDLPTKKKRNSPEEPPQDRYVFTGKFPVKIIQVCIHWTSGQDAS